MKYKQTFNISVCMYIAEVCFKCMCYEQYYPLYLPHENAKSTNTYKKKNFMISITILDNETCNGPKCGFTEKI